VSVFEMYDPLVVHDGTPESALTVLLDYVINMYGLQLVRSSTATEAAARDLTLSLLNTHFVYCHVPAQRGSPAWQHGPRTWQSRLTISRSAECCTAELPRVALVGAGTKPPN
jgi:hypothetical protein